MVPNRYSSCVLNSLCQGEFLWVSDPKALQYIYQPSGYNYAKLPERRAGARLHSGHGLVWADGRIAFYK